MLVWTSERHWSTNRDYLNLKTHLLNGLLCTLRYADVVVHRLLAATLNIETLPDSARDTNELKVRHALSLFCLSLLYILQ